MYLKSATVVSASGDGSCLYHSFSYILNREKLYTENGFPLRHVLHIYIRAHLNKEIWKRPDYCETYEEAKKQRTNVDNKITS